MRIWDKFLSENDKRFIGASGLKKPMGYGKRPALMLIDNWVAVLGTKPLPLEESIKEYPMSTGLVGWEAVKHQKRLLKLCREINIPIIHTTLDTDPHSPRDWMSAVRGDPKKRTMRPLPGEKSATSDPRLFAFTPDLAPIDEEIIIRKSAASPFHGTYLVSALTRFSIDTLLICGESTSGCVRAAAVDGASYCYRVIIVEECVYDRTEACHAINLFDMNQKYGEVRGIEDVTGWLHNIFTVAKAG
jgi:nicotinamidase-related amidase